MDADAFSDVDDDELREELWRRLQQDVSPTKPVPVHKPSAMEEPAAPPPLHPLDVSPPHRFVLRAKREWDSPGQASVADDDEARKHQALVIRARKFREALERREFLRLERQMEEARKVREEEEFRQAMHRKRKALWSLEERFADGSNESLARQAAEGKVTTAIAWEETKFATSERKRKFLRFMGVGKLAAAAATSLVTSAKASRERETVAAEELPAAWPDRFWERGLTEPLRYVVPRSHTVIEFQACLIRPEASPATSGGTLPLLFWFAGLGGTGDALKGLDLVQLAKLAPCPYVLVAPQRPLGK